MIYPNQTINGACRVSKSPWLSESQSFFVFRNPLKNNVLHRRAHRRRGSVFSSECDSLFVLIAARKHVLRRFSCSLSRQQHQSGSFTSGSSPMHHCDEVSEERNGRSVVQLGGWLTVMHRECEHLFLFDAKSMAT